MGEAEKKDDELSIPPSDDIQPESNPVSELASDALPATQEQEWVSGLKLFTIMTGVTLVCLLMLLDTSIIVTVFAKIFLSCLLLRSNIGYSSHYKRLSFSSRCRLVWCCISAFKVRYSATNILYIELLE